MRVGVYPTLPADINDGWLTLNTSELSLLSIELSAVMRIIYVDHFSVATIEPSQEKFSEQSSVNLLKI